MTEGLSDERQSAQTIFDLFATNNTLEIFLKAGVAEELQITELQNNPDMLRTVNSALISNKMIVHLVQEARRGQENSYAPYSHFNVGAAILAVNKAGDSRVFTGCNVENAAYGSTICAERTASFKAVSEGYRKFTAFAVVGGFDMHMSKARRRGAEKSYITPCGSCRQVTNEFEANPCVVIMAKLSGEVYITTLQYLLPAGFGPTALGVDALLYEGGPRRMGTEQ